MPGREFSIKKSGFDGVSKICSVCGKRLLLTKFSLLKTGVGGVRPTCRVCRASIEK